MTLPSPTTPTPLRNQADGAVGGVRLVELVAALGAGAIGCRQLGSGRGVVGETDQVIDRDAKDTRSPHDRLESQARLVALDARDHRLVVSATELDGQVDLGKARPFTQLCQPFADHTRKVINKKILTNAYRTYIVNVWSA